VKQIRLPRAVPYLVLVASVGLTGMTTLAPRPDRPIAAIFPPWWSPARAFTAAAQSGGEIVRVGALPTILVMAPSGSDPSQSDLPRLLRNAGALLLLDAQALGACSEAS
jgi:hypothetical protein